MAMVGYHTPARPAAHNDVTATLPGDGKAELLERPDSLRAGNA
jgi:hypothetical protein